MLFDRVNLMGERFIKLEVVQSDDEGDGYRLSRLDIEPLLAQLSEATLLPDAKSQLKIDDPNWRGYFENMGQGRILDLCPNEDRQLDYSWLISQN